MPIMMKNLLLFTLATFPAALCAETATSEVSPAAPASTVPAVVTEESNPEKQVTNTPSVHELKESLARDPSQFDLWVQLSEYYRLADNRADFLETLDNLRKHFPEDPIARSVYADAWIQLGEWQRLEPVLKEAEVTVQDPVKALRDGIAKAREGRYFESLILLEAAHRADPEQAQVLLNLASFYCRFQRCDDGIVLFRKLTELRPDDVIAHLALAKAAKTENLVDEGIAAVYRAEELLKTLSKPNPRLDQELNELLLHFINLQAESGKAEGESTTESVEVQESPES